MSSGKQRWESFYRDGKIYCDRAIAGARTGKYSPEVIHGLVSLGAENLLMALLLCHGKIPNGHTFLEMTGAASEICDIDNSLYDMLLHIDEMIPLCSLDPAQSWAVDPSLIPLLAGTAVKVRAAVDKALFRHL